MTRYLISFPSGAMDHIPREELPAVGKAAHAVVQEAMDAGVWVFGGGLAEDVEPVMVAGDGTITAGTYPQTREFNGGLTVLDLPSRGRPRSGPRRLPPRAAALKRSVSSCLTRRWATERRIHPPYVGAYLIFRPTSLGWSAATVPGVRAAAAPPTVLAAKVREAVGHSAL